MNRKGNLSDDDDSANESWLNLSHDSKKHKNDTHSDENLSDSDNEMPNKKIKIDSPKPIVPAKTEFKDAGYEKSQRMMAKMGFQPGKGLGRDSQGIVKPIEESDQKGRRGLGFSSDKPEVKAESWDYTTDEITAKEVPEWLSNNDFNVPDLDKLLSWIKRGSKKLKLDDEDNFCSMEILKQVLECKSVFDDLENRQLLQARSKSNPFESIGSIIFQNRAAMKMANIDSVFNEMFTNPKDIVGKSKIEQGEPLYFCDICAGPGGFSEYILWRKKYKAKGFGFTLKGDCDFKLDEFIAGAPEYFEPYYGVNGLDGDGDITNPENLKEFERFVLNSTNQKGVHFVMADGGFSVEGNENIQEILSKQLYLCQFLCALSVLRIGGNFVCKLFDLFTPFSCGLIYLLYLCFDRICIHKPVTSRPANSERYIICENMKECKTTIQSYFYKINEELWAYTKSNRNDVDIRSIVPLDVIKNETEFYRYIKNSNEKFGKIQILNLKKIKAFSTNPNLFDQRQEQIREECLKLWNIPDQPRAQGGRVKHHKFMKRKFNQINTNISNPDETFNKLNNELKKSRLELDIKTIFTNKLKELNVTHLDEKFKKCSIYDYRCMISCGELVLLLSCGRSNVYEYNFQNQETASNSSHGANNNNSKWKKIDKLEWNIELPRDSIILAEKVLEYTGVDKAQIYFKAIHIVDVFFLDGVNLLIKNDKIISLNDRMKDLKILEETINKKSRPELKTIRVKDLIRFEDLQTVFQSLSYKKRKKLTAEHRLGIHVPLNKPTEYYVYPTGIYLFKFVNYPWSVLISKRTGRKYFYNGITQESLFDPPSDGSFCSTPKAYWDDGYVWKWTNDTRVEENELDDENQPNETTIVTKQKLLQFINSKLYI